MPHESERPPGANRRPEKSKNQARASTTDSVPADVWRVIRSGWVAAGSGLPRPGSRAFHALPADCPVRRAVVAMDRLGVDRDVCRYGPTAARALTAMRAEGMAA